MEQLRILWIAKSYTMPKAGVKPHSHPYCHMFLVEEGCCRFTVNKQQYDILPGQCILVPPKMEHGYTNEGDIPVRYLELKFVAGKPMKLITTEDPLAAMLFRRIIQEYPELGSLADKAAASYLAALLSAIVPREQPVSSRRFRYVDGYGYNELAQQVIAYLEKHYREELRLDDIAQHMGYNKSYLCVAFKKDAGFTILDCLNTIRVRRAAELLVYSDQSLQQVADMCGFASVSHFNRVFLKCVGNTPGQCRRAYPVDILFSPKEGTPPADRSGRFMYSALAHKTITPEMIRELDILEKAEPKT